MVWFLIEAVAEAAASVGGAAEVASTAAPASTSVAMEPLTVSATPGTAVQMEPLTITGSAPSIQMDPPTVVAAPPSSVVMDPTIITGTLPTAVTMDPLTIIGTPPTVEMDPLVINAAPPQVIEMDPLVVEGTPPLMEMDPLVINAARPSSVEMDPIVLDVPFYEMDPLVIEAPPPTRIDMPPAIIEAPPPTRVDMPPTTVIIFPPETIDATRPEGNEDTETIRRILEDDEHPPLTLWSDKEERKGKQYDRDVLRIVRWCIEEATWRNPRTGEQQNSQEAVINQARVNCIWLRNHSGPDSQRSLKGRDAERFIMGLQNEGTLLAPGYDTLKAVLPPSWMESDKGVPPSARGGERWLYYGAQIRERTIEGHQDDHTLPTLPSTGPPPSGRTKMVR